MPVSNRAWPQRSECVWAWGMVCAGGVATGVPCACARPRTNGGRVRGDQEVCPSKKFEQKVPSTHTLYL